MAKITTIQLKIPTRKKLGNIAVKYGESMDKIINRLIDNYEEKKQ